MVVLKFGGSSVATLEQIDRVLDIAVGELGRAPVMVSSAMGGTTDALEEVAAFSKRGQEEQALTVLEELREAHRGAAESMAEEHRAGALATVDELFSELRALVHGAVLIQECSPRTHDTILSFGERLATTIIAARCADRGIPHCLLDSRRLIRTDQKFTRAAVLRDQTYRLIQESVEPHQQKLRIAQGFIGATEEGVTTTLGRGGSDYTAAIFAAALGAEELQIWTDVDGIMTADPRVVDAARPVAQLTYEEAAELAYFGAKVVHPQTIQPAVQRRVPVLVRNTRNLDSSGSRITGEPLPGGVRALAFRGNTVLVTVQSSRMLDAHGFLARLFAIFDRHRVSVDLVATSEVSVSISVDKSAELDSLRQELSGLGHVTIAQDVGILSLVGLDLWKDSRVVARVFGALTDIPIRLISLGASEVNLSLVIPEETLAYAARLLHFELFEKEGSGQ